MVGWRRQFSAPAVGDGQGSLVCCSPWHRKMSDTTELNGTELNMQLVIFSFSSFYRCGAVGCLGV